MSMETVLPLCSFPLTLHRKQYSSSSPPQMVVPQQSPQVPCRFAPNRSLSKRAALAQTNTEEATTRLASQHGLRRS
jgi:hypothetical protein